MSTEEGPTRVLRDASEVHGGAESAESEASATALLATPVPETDTSGSPAPAEADAPADLTVLSGGPVTSPPAAPSASPAAPAFAPAPTATTGATSDERPVETAAVDAGTVAMADAGTGTGTVAMAGSAPGTTVIDRASTSAPVLEPPGADEPATDRPAGGGGTSQRSGAGWPDRPAPRPPARPSSAQQTARSHAERRVMIILVVLIVVLALALLVVRLSSSDGDKPDAQSTAPVTAAVANGATPGDAAAAALATDSTPMVAPPGWVSYVDPSGWSLAYPALWQRQVGTGGPGMVDFVDPGTGTFLRVGSLASAPRSVLDDWLKNFETAFSGDAQRYPGFQQVRLAPADGGEGTSEADLEFTYRTDGGKVHVLDRGASRGGHGYLLYWQTGEERWTVDQPLRQQMFASFRPAS